MEAHLINALKNLGQSNPSDDIESLYDHMGGEVWAESPQDIYTFLIIAAEMGFTTAGDMSDDILECSDMRYDDDGYIRANSLMEAAEVLFLGLHGIPKNFEKAKTVLGFLNDDFGHFFEDYLSEDVSQLFSSLDSKEREILKKEFPALTDA